MSNADQKKEEEWIQKRLDSDGKLSNVYNQVVALSK
jgi:hypothetical protein